MARFDFHRVLQLVMGALSLGLIAGLLIVWWQRSRTEYLTLAAGAPSGESYILGNALKTVLERHYPKIRLTLLKAGGRGDQRTPQYVDGRSFQRQRFPALSRRSSGHSRWWETTTILRWAADAGDGYTSGA